VKFFITSSAIYFFSFVTADPDLWGHVRFGQAIWATKALPTHNLYSFTAPDHPWINHEWLSELIFYATYNFFGDAGLLFLKLSIGLAIVWLISKIGLFRPVQIILFGICFGLVISVMSPGFMVRPHIFSFLWFTCFFYIFHCYFDRNKNRLWLLPPIMIIWCNSHGGFLTGWGQFTIVLVWQSIVYVFKDKAAGPSLRVLLLWYLITTAACFVTPYGYKLIVFLYHSLSKLRPIEEWNPITILDTTFIRFKILAALFVVSCAYPSGRWKRWDTLVVLATLVFAIKHQRHTPFFAIMVGPSLVEWLTLVFDKLKVDVGRFLSSHATRSTLSAFLLLLVSYQTTHAAYRYMKASLHIIVDPSFYPVQAVNFIQTNQIKGNVLLPFEWGEYAIWKLHPRCRVSIDGRFRTAYPEDVLMDHIFPINDDVAWSRLIKKYPADIILSRQIPYFWNLMKASQEWIYVYSDRAAMIFVRDNEQNRRVLKNFRLGKLVYPHGPISQHFP
jgi:hypothetical protein